MCASLARFYRASTLESFRAALVWRQVEDMPIEACWTQSIRFRRRFRGAMKLCLDPVPRGSVTFSQLRTLTSRCSERGEIDYARGFIVAFYGLLRHSEITSLRRSDIEVSHTEALLRIRGGKGRRNNVVDIVEVPEAHDLLVYLKTSSSH